MNTIRKPARRLTAFKAGIIAFSLALFVAAFPIAARASSEELARVQALLDNTPEGSPFRARLELRLKEIADQSCTGLLKTLDAQDPTLEFNQHLKQQVEAQAPLRIRQDQRNAPAVYLLGETLSVEIPGLKLTVALFQMNDLDTLLEALRLAAAVEDPEDAFKVKQVGLFEVTQRLHPQNIKKQPLKGDDVVKLAEILRLSVHEVFVGLRTPVSLPGLNPIRNAVHAVFVDRKNNLSPDDRYLLASALLAGIADADYADFAEYLRPLHQAWLALGKKGWLGGRRSTSYDAGIRAKTLKL